MGVNHLEAHALVPRLLQKQQKQQHPQDIDDLDFPFMVVLVSGGHSQILGCLGVNQYIQIGVSKSKKIAHQFLDSCLLT